MIPLRAQPDGLHPNQSHPARGGRESLVPIWVIAPPCSGRFLALDNVLCLSLKRIAAVCGWAGILVVRT